VVRKEHVRILPWVTASFAQNARLRVANKRRSNNELNEIDAIVERLREFLRLNYMTGAEVARRIGVGDMTVYSWARCSSGLLRIAIPADRRNGWS
jgi:hypothetical protein